VVPGLNALVTVECDDPQAFWAASYAETLLLRVWYPITVATLSRSVKKLIKGFLDETSDDPAGQIAFKLHDFGARGVSSAESAAIGGCAHLVNFMGTDTVSALLAARQYYGEPLAAFSIPAAEHSSITSWGRDNEVEAYRNMLRRFARPGALVAVVSDSYDIYHAVDKLWGEALRQEVIDSGATVVIRPDSGYPAEVVLKTAVLLERRFGSVTNGKGYRVLNNVRIIQGDGINPRSIREILAGLKVNGFAADNVAFGIRVGDPAARDAAEVRRRAADVPGVEGLQGPGPAAGLKTRRHRPPRRRDRDGRRDPSSRGPRGPHPIPCCRLWSRLAQ